LSLGSQPVAKARSSSSPENQRVLHFRTWVKCGNHPDRIKHKVSRLAEAKNHFKVLDCNISRMNMDRAVCAVSDRIGTGQGGYVCFVNVHTVVTSRKDTRLREAINQAFLALPDGRPLSLVAKWRRLQDVERVTGPDFMPYFLQRSKRTRHFLLGSTEEILNRLQKRLEERFPDVGFVGTYAPPFGPFDDKENERIFEMIRKARPDIVWIGLGAPKQEYWMAGHWKSIKPAILMGVGAAFDFHAGKISRAPRWIQALSIEWLYRLLQEPKRLWKRYLVTNTRFLFYMLRDLGEKVFLLRKH